MAKNMSKTPQQLLKNPNSDNWLARWMVALSSSTTPEVLLDLLEMLGDDNEDIRREAAYNPNATPEVLLKAMRDKDWQVRYGAAYNRNATPEVLMKALKDKYADVRFAAAGNPNIKTLDIPVEKWVEYIVNGYFNGVTKNIPSHVKKHPRYKSTMLLYKLVKTPS